MELLTLIEEKCLSTPPQIAGQILLAAGRLPLETSVVVGMQLRERPEMYMRGYRRTGHESRRELELRYSHARRWAEFFEKHMVSSADHDHDSEEIVRYILGMDITTVHTGGPWPPLTCAQADPDNLELSRGYSILQDREYGKNLVYGINDPALCLGSIGSGRALIVAPAQLLIDFHQAQAIGEIVGGG